MSARAGLTPRSQSDARSALIEALVAYDKGNKPLAAAWAGEAVSGINAQRALAERQRQHSTEILCAAVAPRSRPTLGEKVAGVFSVGILVVGFAVWIVPGAAEQVVGWLQ
jgi:hypothetical protein